MAYSVEKLAVPGCGNFESNIEALGNLKQYDLSRRSWQPTSERWGQDVSP
jgi:hypothetical protein